MPTEVAAPDARRPAIFSPLDARGKILLALAYVIAVVALPAGYWRALGALGLVLAFVLGLAGVSFRTMLVRWLPFAAVVGFIALTIAPGLTAHADKALMRVVLDNLIGNAWKYTGKTAGARIEVDREPAPDRPWFVVRDNGAGFDPKYAPKLFQPFQRLHRADEFPGHGVGLATVLRVVRRHGGAVAADGARGGGATFRFSIP